MFNYKKIIAIGCSGAGKSTFSRKLQKATGIELFHLDAMYWNKDGTHITREELIEKQKEIFKKDSFIIDGNFRNTLEMRISEADLIFFFDLPTEVCIHGAENREGRRPEMPCELPVNKELIDFIKNFNADVKPRILELLEKFNKKVITFHSHKEADEYIEKISQYYKIEAIILFGSYAKGTENEDSDIDIAIISSDFSDIIEDGAKLIGLTWKIDTRIEPHPITTEDYQKISNPFVREVIDTGIKVA